MDAHAPEIVNVSLQKLRFLTCPKAGRVPHRLRTRLRTGAPPLCPPARLRPVSLGPTEVVSYRSDESPVLLLGARAPFRVRPTETIQVSGAGRSVRHGDGVQEAEGVNVWRFLHRCGADRVPLVFSDHSRNEHSNPHSIHSIQHPFKQSDLRLAGVLPLSH